MDIRELVEERSGLSDPAKKTKKTKTKTETKQKKEQKKKNKKKKKEKERKREKKRQPTTGNHTFNITMQFEALFSCHCDYALLINDAYQGRPNIVHAATFTDLFHAFKKMFSSSNLIFLY